MPLRPKQEAFCREYLVDLNATQAAVRAGYSQKTAYSTGHENLKKPEIQSRVQELMAERSERVELDADFVVKHLMENAMIAMGHKPKKKVFYGEDGVTEIVVHENDLNAANKALELLGKHRDVNLWKETKQVESSVTGFVVVPPKDDQKND